MTFRNWIGVAMLATPFVAMFSVATAELGINVAMAVFLGTLGLVGFLGVAAKLAMEER